MSAPTTNIPVAIPAGASSGAGRTGQPPRTIAGSIPGARGMLDRLLHGTPGRMRLFGLLGVIAAVLLGVVSVNALLASQAAVERAANNTAQVSAPSRSTSTCSAPTPWPPTPSSSAASSPPSPAPATRAPWPGSPRGIAEAAAAQPADGKALGVLAERVQTYAALVEQARSNNRLGLPVGAQYLTQASAGLRSDAIPIVTQVVQTNEDRSQKEFDRSNSSLQLLVGVAALIGLVALAVWLARRTHRYLNPSLTGAIALLLVALFVTATIITGIGSATRGVSQGDYQRAVALADVTTAANDARANESLTLIRRFATSTVQNSHSGMMKQCDCQLSVVSSSRKPIQMRWVFRADSRVNEARQLLAKPNDEGQRGV